MSNLISGKEAKLAWANGKELEVAHATIQAWESLTDNYMLSVFDNGSYVFRLKPQTITINGIEVPAPFEPDIGEKVYSLCGIRPEGYESWVVQRKVDGRLVWRTEDEIKQVVEALRSIFK